jgi:endoglucanase
METHSKMTQIVSRVNLPVKYSLTNNSKKMLKKLTHYVGCLLFFMAFNAYSQPVAINGLLSVSGNKIVNKNGIAVSFAGNSLFWCNDGWGGEKYYNSNTVSWLRNDWNSAIVRAAMGVESDGGYLANKAGNKAKVKAVVDAAIANDMYVIIDWHTHNAEWNTNEAIDFFKEMAQTYGNKPNVIYEVYNEPINSSWSNDIKPYAEKVIDAIRAIDPDNLIIVGTRFYSAYVNEAADNPINKNNIAYTIHFYAAQHKEDYRERCRYALNKGVALFATEWGAVNADGGGNVDESETAIWMDFLKQNKISHCNWSINDKNEGASALSQGASGSGNWSSNNLTWSGSVVRNILKSYDYGKLSDEVSFSNAPIITRPKLSYTFKIAYTATQSRELIVSFLDNQGSVLATSKTQVNGSGEKDVVLNLSQLPTLSSDYSYTCEIRPISGNASTNLEKKTISNVTIVANEPLVVVEAESYDVMSGVQKEICAEGGENLGYIETSDWMSYPSISITKAGKYIVYYRVASANAGGKISLEKDAGQTVLGVTNIPATGDWQIWNTVSQEVDLPAGSYSLGIGIPSGGFNLNLFAISAKSDINGIEDFDFSPSATFNVFPSPAKDFIYVNGITENSTVSIFNLSGEKLKETQNNRMDISSFPSGIYFVKVGNLSRKFIKE